MSEAGVKTALSIPYFLETKIRSCTDIVRKNGRVLALPYSGKRPASALASKRQGERRSVTHETYQVRSNLHLGMQKKPLERYNPEAHRSRMRTEEYVMPYKNTSSVVIGDRSSSAKNHYMTTAQSFSRRPKSVYTTNEGILSEMTKWQHTRAAL